MKPGPKPRDLKVRFYDKFEINNENDCWIWKSTVSNNNRGVIRINRKTEVAQRVSWQLFNGEIPKGKSVLNTCKNDLCVNPDHLYLGSHKERDSGKIPRPLNERFWEKVSIKKENECWEWLAMKCSFGYGRFCKNGININAHRISWELTSSKRVPNGLFVCHTCDNPGCVNPYHLFLGTHLDNMRDRKKKNRYNTQPRGENNSSHKLTEQQVREIKAEKIKYGDLTRLAKKYSVTKQAIKLIIDGKNWSYLDSN